MSIADPARFSGKLRSASVGDVMLSEMAVDANGVEVRRTKRLVRRNDPDCIEVGVQFSSRCTVHQDDRHSTLQPGDMAVYDTLRPYRLRFTESYRSACGDGAQGAAALPRGAAGRPDRPDDQRPVGSGRGGVPVLDAGRRPDPGRRRRNWPAFRPIWSAHWATPTSTSA
nr:hypothetical protein [Mycobacterium tilburgii]